MADLDFGKIKLYVGNATISGRIFWTSAKLQADRNAKQKKRSNNFKNSLDSLPMFLNQDKQLT